MRSRQRPSDPAGLFFHSGLPAIATSVGTALPGQASRTKVAPAIGPVVPATRCHRWLRRDGEEAGAARASQATWPAHPSRRALRALPGMTLIGAENAYLPMQKSRKITSRISSTSTRPVSRPSAVAAGAQFLQQKILLGRNVRALGRAAAPPRRPQEPCGGAPGSPKPTRYRPVLPFADPLQLSQQSVKALASRCRNTELIFILIRLQFISLW